MNVKSAIRVFEVLEFFDEVQRDASLSEIARRLGCPVSSTSMLLRQAGCSISVDQVSPGAGVVAVHVPTPLHESPLAVGIGGPSHLIRDNASSFSKLLKDAVRTSCVLQPTVAKRRAATAGLA